MECFRGLDVIPFCETEVDQNGHILVRKQDIRGPVEISILFTATRPRELRISLYVVVHNTVLMEELNPRQQRAEPVLGM